MADGRFGWLQNYFGTQSEDSAGVVAAFRQGLGESGFGGGRVVARHHPRPEQGAGSAS
jgi:hypothetical protein